MGVQACPTQNCLTSREVSGMRKWSTARRGWRGSLAWHCDRASANPRSWTVDVAGQDVLPPVGPARRRRLVERPARRSGRK